MNEPWRDEVEAELSSLTREQREAIDAWLGEDADFYRARAAWRAEWLRNEEEATR